MSGGSDTLDAPTLSSSSAERTVELGRMLACSLKPDDVVYLNGDLGAGKTQFAKGVAQGLGISDEVTSPTFTILLEYEGGALTLFHFDLYRLEHADELDDIDFFGVLESGGASLVEWGDKFPDALPDEFLELDFRVRPDGTRLITAVGHGRRGHELQRSFAGGGY